MSEGVAQITHSQNKDGQLSSSDIQTTGLDQSKQDGLLRIVRGIIGSALHPADQIQRIRDLLSQDTGKKQLLSPVEREARQTLAQRRDEAAKLIKQGKSLKQIIEYFDNDYSALADLYKEKVGVDLITDSYEAIEHPIPITKSCSIVIPAYNNAVALKNSLLSIQASTFNAKYPQKLEVVIVDDGSPNIDIAQAVKEMGLTDLNIKVYRESNGRENKARYSGVLHATGDIVIFTAQDIVYTPSTIEEYMKRHEVLDGIACFGLRPEINEGDERLKPERIAQGSLRELPVAIEEDSRVKQEAMADSDWLKKVGKEKVLPMDTDNDWYGWTLGKAAWGLSVSAPREALLKTMSAYDAAYKGFGYDDENLISELIADGYYIIPNTGGAAYHQRHPLRRNEKEQDLNSRVWSSHLNSSPRRQDIHNPLQTDSKLEIEIKNHRVVEKLVSELAPSDPYQRALALSRMGLYKKAVDVFNQAEPTHQNDYWFMHDMAVALTALGGEKNVSQAIEYLERVMAMNPNETWVNSSLAIAYGRKGEYQKCLEAYKNALKLDPNNWQAAIIEPLNKDPNKRASELHKKGAEIYLYRGKPREALRYYEAALSLVGEERQSWSVFDKGKVLYQIGHYAEAISNLQKAKALMPNKTWVDSQLGLTYEAWKKPKKAAKYYKAALQKDAENWEAKEGLTRLDLGLYQDWDRDFTARRSETLTNNPQAELNEADEVRRYLESRPAEYLDELRKLNESIRSPMSSECRMVILIPALEEGAIIRKTLDQYLHQKDKEGKPLDSNLFEIIVLDNHSPKIPKDNTEDEVSRFRKEHPEIHVHYVHKVWKPGERPCVGNARRYVSDLAVLRSTKRASQTGDLILASADADVEGLNEHYVRSYIEEFDSNKYIDMATGKWDLPEDVLKKPNLRAAVRLWYFIDRVIAKDAVGRPEYRRIRSPKLIGRNAAIRAAMYAAIGGYNPNVKLAEDLEIGWMVDHARKEDPKRCVFINRTEVISSPRRFLTAMAQGIPLINMYDDFHENRNVKRLNNEELLKMIPDKFDINRFEEDADAIWQEGEDKEDGSYGYLEHFEALFKRAMEFVGVNYIIEKRVDPDGQTRTHIKVTNIDKLFGGLHQSLS